MLVLGLARAPRIAVVEIAGAIGAAVRPLEYGRLFRSLEENSRIRAVILDIDSSGGSATASDYLYLAIAALAAKKPVVAFIRGAGASGAYLLSCAATRIVAIPGAIVGSIGVVAVRPLIQDVMRRVGVKVQVTKSGRLKDMGSVFRDPTQEERRKEQELINEFFDYFIDAVARGRKLEPETVRKIATGEVFTARKSKEMGLVDELGDIERAIDLAAELGKTARRVTWVRPRRGLRDLFTSSLAGAFADEFVRQVEARLPSGGVFYQYRF